MKIKKVMILGLAISLVACDSKSNSDESPQNNVDNQEPQSRNLQLGMTSWPYDVSLDALENLYSIVRQNSDFVAHHLQGGIPWDEALADQNYSDNLESIIDQRLDLNGDSLVYLSIDPLNAARDGLALYWGDNENEALPAEWQNRSFDSDQVIQAYINFANDMIRRFEPSYFNMAAEASEYLLNQPEDFEKLEVFIREVYAQLKAEHPDVIFLTSIAAKSPDSQEAQIIRDGYSQLVRHSDMLGISIYPFAFFEHQNKGDPDTLPQDWLSQFISIANSKPMAITETGWPAEDLVIDEYQLNLSISEADQSQYVTMLLNEGQKLDLQFINWFAVVDYDALWEIALGQDNLSRIWRDTGLISEELEERPALQVWQDLLSQSR